MSSSLHRGDLTWGRLGIGSVWHIGSFKGRLALALTGSSTDLALDRFGAAGFLPGIGQNKMCFKKT